MDLVGEGRDLMFSLNYACDDCGISIEEMQPRMFSFNNPFGACPEFTGLGAQLKISEDLIIPNRALSISEGAISGSNWGNIKSDSITRMYLEALAKRYGFSFSSLSVL